MIREGSWLHVHVIETLILVCHWQRKILCKLNILFNILCNILCITFFKLFKLGCLSAKLQVLS